MIKRILVALDPDSDTPAATRYAAEIARRHGAELTGLAVVDTGSIEAGARGGAVGSMYYAEKLRENLTEETRAKARELISEFEQSIQDEDVPYEVAVREGVPFRRILEDMKYHDLLIVGREPHFFYGHPEQKTKTLGRVVKEATAPALVVGKSTGKLDNVMVAYDGSPASARTTHYFLHLLPFGRQIHAEIVHVHDGSESESELMLNLLATYFDKHGLKVRTTSMRGDRPADIISEHAASSNFDVVVAGAHSVSKIKEWAFGSTTASLLEKCPRPMFLYH